MILTSRFRTGFWIRQLIQYVGGLVLIGICFRFCFDNGKIDFRSILFWVGCFGIVSYLFFFAKFLFDEIKQLTVSDNGITVKYLVTKKISIVQFADIKNTITKIITHRQGAGRTAGYHELEIELLDGRLITFNEDQYENYSEIKNEIYNHIRNEN